MASLQFRPVGLNRIQPLSQRTTLMQLVETIQQNLATVMSDVGSACRLVDRDPGSVRLVAVTKYAEWEWVQALATVHTVFGENRPQQLAERQAMLPAADWHLIGQLQRNKVRLALQHAALIHSVDSLRLMNRIAVVATELKMRPRLLLQVNVSGEESKSGFSPSGLQNGWPRICDAVDHVDIAGLMTMAPVSDHPDDARPTFGGLRELREQLAARPESRSVGLDLAELSMGMSGDFQVAVEEGATLVRIGSRLFEGLGG